MPPRSVYPLRMADRCAEIRLWLWEYTDEFGKRRRSTWRMTEPEAAHYIRTR